MLTGSGFPRPRAYRILHGMSREAWRRHEAGGQWFLRGPVSRLQYNMTDIQAAIGLSSQLRRLSDFQQRRRAAVAPTTPLSPRRRLRRADRPARVWTTRGTCTCYACVPASCASTPRSVHRRTDRRNIGTSVHFIPVHMPRLPEKYCFSPGDFPVPVRVTTECSASPPTPARRARRRGVIDAVYDVASEQPAVTLGKRLLDVAGAARASPSSGPYSRVIAVVGGALGGGRCSLRRNASAARGARFGCGSFSYDARRRRAARPPTDRSGSTLGSRASARGCAATRLDELPQLLKRAVAAT